MQLSPYWTPPPGAPPKVEVGSIWATVRTNLDEWVSANVFLEKVFITTDGGIQHPHPTRRDVALPIMGYRIVVRNDPLVVSRALVPKALLVCPEPTMNFGRFNARD